MLSLSEVLHQMDSVKHYRFFYENALYKFTFDIDIDILFKSTDHKNHKITNHDGLDWLLKNEGGSIDYDQLKMLAQNERLNPAQWAQYYIEIISYSFILGMLFLQVCGTYFGYTYFSVIVIVKVLSLSLSGELGSQV